MKKFTYHAPGSHVWIYTDGNGREPGTVESRQSGTYRVKFDSDKHYELRKAADLGVRHVGPQSSSAI